MNAPDRGLDPLLDVESVTKVYPGADRASLVDVDLQVYPGEIVGLLGPNGAGKSTLIHAVLGLHGLTKGRIRVDGAAPGSRDAVACLGFVPDDLPLPELLTAREYLQMVLAATGLPRQRGAGRTLLDDALDDVGLDPASRKLVSSFSHGMRQRLKISAAMLGRPRLLVLDEPFSGLDPDAATRLRRLVTTFRDGGGGVLLSSHDLLFAAKYCDRVVVLAEGERVADDAPAAIVARCGAADLEDAFAELVGLRA